MPSFEVVLASLSTAGSMAKGFLALKTEGERQQLVIDLQAKILEAQKEAMDVREHANAIHDRMDELDRELTDLRDKSAIVARMRRAGEMMFLPDDPDPCCRRCAEVEVGVVHLSKTARTEMRRRVYQCPKCRTEFIDWPAGERA